MAGGKGTRLWPISRRNKPKQFQRLISDKTMLQETFSRMREKFNLKDIYISTNQEYASEVEKEIPELPKNNIIKEPISRGTASSMALNAAIIAAKNENEIIAQFPADHLIKNPKALMKALDNAEKFIKTNGKDQIVTFGIKPNSPEIGFGYIKKGSLIESYGKQKIYNVPRFVEKPDMATAQRYIDSKQFFWNSGIYIWKASSIIKKFKKYIPDTYYRLIRIKNAFKTLNFMDVLRKEYPLMDNISIEYGIVENDDKIAVLPVDLEWSDVGSWSALKEVLVKDKKGHFIKGEHIDFGSENLLVYGSKKLVTTIGLKDLIIIDSEDAILICDNYKSELISDVVKKLEKSGKIALL